MNAWPRMTLKMRPRRLSASAEAPTSATVRGHNKAPMSGMKHFFVEQGGNFAHDSMQSITDCAACVKRYLLPPRG